MKFPMPSWDASPAACDEFRKAYSRHLVELRDKLSDRVLQLSELQGVDDGLIAEFYHNRSGRFIRLTLRCANLEMGHYDLVLCYTDAEISNDDELLVAQIVREELDLRWFEIDVTDGGKIEQRFEFHSNDISKCWFSIRGTTLEWHTVKKDDRQLPELKDRLREDITY